MKYACLIYGDETALQKMSKDEMSRLAAEGKAFHEELQKSGRFVAFLGFAHPHTATTVSVREGKTLMTDGPFAETKEILGSVYVIEAKDLNEALRVAATFPGARIGSIEVRPTWEWK